MSASSKYVNKPEPVPPNQHIQNAGHHWLNIKDFDGHSFGYVVMQWQPHAQKWCASGDVATGRDVDTRAWEYMEAIPNPKI